MKNKRGQFMALYLVLLTFLLCSMVMLYYTAHQEDMAVSLISPLEVLEVSDSLDIFEMREYELILKSLETSGLDKDKFKEEFVGGVNMKMREFIFSNLYWNDQEMAGDFDREAFLNNILYSVRNEGGGIVLTRNKIGKKIYLEADSTSAVNFPVDFYFDFSVKYIVSKKGSKFEVEKI